MGHNGASFIQCTTKKLSEKIGDEAHGHPSTSHASMQNNRTATSHLAFESESESEVRVTVRVRNENVIFQSEMGTLGRVFFSLY